MDDTPWHLLHDGKIVDIRGSIPGDLRLLLNIPFLCQYLPTKSSQLSVSLLACAQFEYHPFEGETICELANIASLELDILDAGHSMGNFEIGCADGGCGGNLLTNYKTASIETVEGTPLSECDLETACAQYWAEWRAKNATQ